MYATTCVANVNYIKPDACMFHIKDKGYFQKYKISTCHHQVHTKGN